MTGSAGHASTTWPPGQFGSHPGKGRISFVAPPPHEPLERIAFLLSGSHRHPMTPTVATAPRASTDKVREHSLNGAGLRAPQHGNRDVDRYRSPRSGNTTTISLPAFSERCATWIAARTA